MPGLTLTEQSLGNYSVEGCLTFSGIDQHSLAAFKFLKGLDAICIDFSNVDAADSAGLALMIEWIKLSRSQNINLSFKNIPAQLVSLAKLSGLDSSDYFAEHCQATARI
jgi:phospholipid transport system transporter-binding protein